jgi:hypothetical protein
VKNYIVDPKYLDLCYHKEQAYKLPKKDSSNYDKEHAYKLLEKNSSIQPSTTDIAM